MTSNTAQTWLVIFDQLSHSLIAANSPNDDGTTVFRPFDWLETHSLVYEQFHRQDCDDSTGESSCPYSGVLPELIRAAKQAGRNISELHIHSPEDVSAETRADLANADIVIIRLHNSNSDATSSASLADSLLQRVLEDLVVLPMSSSLDSTEPNRNINLIVTASRGIERTLPTSFDSALNQSVIHLPLWIYSPQLPARRTQVVCGSRDMAPTLAELTGVMFFEPSDTSGQSLLVLAAEETAERILELNGPDWRALRTPTYLLVIRDAAGDEADSSHDEELEPVRRLYLKPDDYWNVNDVYSSYEEIARLMEEM
ncbi:MAG: hypothetical protein JNM43_07850 [Planctomycetaceae bacterium]|nr:hypothetical protein [Planctomycetaceae bacterium]